MDGGRTSGWRARKGSGWCASCRTYGGAGSNFYAHPVEGVAAFVNLTTGKILDFMDIDRNAADDARQLPISTPVGRAAARRRPRRSITQPNGPGFRIEDGEVRWQKWRFRCALHPREGLVLYTVGYEDGGPRAAGDVSRVAFGDGGAVWRSRAGVVLPQ